MEDNLKDVFNNSNEIVLGDKKFIIKTMTMGDIASFQKWCDIKKKKEVIDLYKMAGISPDIKEIMSITGDEDFYNEMMMSLDGVVYLLYKVIKKNNDTDIDEEFVSEHLSIADMESTIKVLFGNFLNDLNEDKESSGKN